MSSPRRAGTPPTATRTNTGAEAAGLRYTAPTSADADAGVGSGPWQHLTRVCPGALARPATRALTAAGYTELGQLAGVPAAELAKLHGVGPKALRLLQEALQAQDMSLG